MYHFMLRYFFDSRHCCRPRYGSGRIEKEMTLRLGNGGLCTSCRFFPKIHCDYTFDKFCALGEVAVPYFALSLILNVIQ